MKKSAFALGLTLALTLVLGACSSSSDKTKDSSSAADTNTIKVGTMGTYNPFSFEDEKGNLTGYDLEVLRLVEKEDPSLKFEFVAGPWDSLFVGLDSDKFQLLANQISATDERKAKYTLTDNQYFTSVSQLIVGADNTEINSLEDLKGKKIGLTTGDAHTFVVEDWNKANGNILDDAIVYYEQDVTTILQDIASGRIDATVNDPVVAADKAKVQKIDVKSVGDRLAAVPTFFIAKQDEEGKALIKKIDTALTSLIEDGKISELSKEQFGEDYSK